MDVVTLGAALNGSKKYTDQVAQSLMGGVHYRGSVSYYDDLPANPAEGDSYTVKYAGSSGSVEDGTEYTWGYDTDTSDYAWISFSKNAYSKAETDVLLSGKQPTIDSTHKLSSDLVDDSSSANKFATAAQLSQIETNKNNILFVQSDIYFEENKSKLAGNIGTRYDADSMTRNWALAATTAIMHGVPISNAIKLKTIKYNVGNTNLYQAHLIGLATISGSTATITHLKRNADYFQGVVTVDVNFELDSTKDYYLFLICQSGIVQWDIDNSGSEYYTFPNPANPAVGTTVSLTKSTGKSIAVAEMDIVFETDGYFITTATAKQGTITVAKSGGDYTTIAEAIAAANDSAANPVTIQLYPGVYNEHITLLNHYISIIGVNRDTCIIRDDSGRYNNDPIKISGGKWRLENLSLISTHSNAGGWTPSWVFPDLPSYALHIDNGSAGGEGIVENCYLYCENLNAIGAGTHNGEKIQIINCEIVRNTTDANYVSSDYKGAVACHSPNIYDDSETASEFSMYNCNITCNLDEALQLKALAATSKMKSTMVGNTLVANNKVTNVVAFAGSLTTKNDYIKIQSHGNSTSELNAIE